MAAALDGAREAGPVPEADARLAACIVGLLAGTAESAVSHAEAAVRLYRAHGQAAGVGELHVWLGMALLEAGRPEAVLALGWDDAQAPSTVTRGLGPMLRSVADGANVDRARAQALLEGAGDEDILLVRLFLQHLDTASGASGDGPSA